MDAPGEKLICQMWETLAEKGIGSLLKPWQIRRESRATGDGRRHELLMLAQAEIDSADVRAGRKEYLPDGTLRLTDKALEVDDKNNQNQFGLRRIEPTISLLPETWTSRAHADTIRKEINQSKAIIYAENQLRSEIQDPSAEKIDSDWLYAWRDHAGKTSNENIQKLWGSVLAGEVQSPGAYSLRTLEFLKGLSQQEAEIIKLIAPFVIKSQMIWRDFGVLNDEGISYASLLKLQELGLVQGVDSNSTNMQFNSVTPDTFLHIINSHGKGLIAKHINGNNVLHIPMIKLTSIGQQVLQLGDYSPNLRYLNALGKYLIKMEYSVDLADCIERSEGKIDVENVTSLNP